MKNKYICNISVNYKYNGKNTGKNNVNYF